VVDESVRPREADGTGDGFTLLDFFVAITGSWAIPFAVLSSLGETSNWRFPAYLTGGLLGLCWAWWCRVIEWHIHARRVSRGPRSRPSTTAAIVVVAFVVAAGLLVQYGLYRGLRFLFGIALAHYGAG
jgi:hypothetical protein